MKAARELGPDEWQYAEIGRKKGIFKKAGKNDDGSPDWQTRLVKDACIFLNRPGFPTGPGLRAAPARAWARASTTAT